MNDVAEFLELRTSQKTIKKKNKKYTSIVAIVIESRHIRIFAFFLWQRVVQHLHLKLFFLFLHEHAIPNSLR